MKVVTLYIIFVQLASYVELNYTIDAEEGSVALLSATPVVSKLCRFGLEYRHLDNRCFRA